MWSNTQKYVSDIPNRPIRRENVTFTNNVYSRPINILMDQNGTENFVSYCILTATVTLTDYYLFTLVSDVGSGNVLDYWTSEVDQLLMTSRRQMCISYIVVLVLLKNLIGERVHCPSPLHQIDGSSWGLRFCRFRRSSLRKSSATGFRFTLTGTAGTGCSTGLLRILYSWTCFFSTCWDNKTEVCYFQ